MKIEVSKTDWSSLLELIDKAVAIIRGSKPSNRDFNIARRLGNIKRDIVRKNEKFINSQK